MSETLQRVMAWIERGEVYVSEHGYDELANDRIVVRDILNGIQDAVVVGDYPSYHKGPAVLVLQRDVLEQPIHVVWGIAINTDSPAVLVTAYRPDPDRWSDDFLRRKP